MHLCSNHHALRIHPALSKQTNRLLEAKPRQVAAGLPAFLRLLIRILPEEHPNPKPRRLIQTLLLLDQIHAGTYIPLTQDLIPRLIVIDPLNKNHDTAASSYFNTVHIQHLLRKVYILMHVNYNCHNGGCRSRMAIERVATGVFENNPRPCCILRRIFWMIK